MHRRQWVWAAAISSTLVTVSAAGYAAFSPAADAHVTFDAAGPAGFKIEGTTSDFSLSEADGNVVLTVGLTNLTTGISMRDHHMREKYLEVQKFPSAILSVSRTVLRVPASGAQIDVDVPGTLTLHGQTRPVSVHYSAKAEGAAISTQGKLHVNMNDFGIQVPTYLGVTVKPEVDIAASFRTGGS